MQDCFDFGNGIIRKYVDFDLDLNIPLFMQLKQLKEDLVQVEYNNGCILDIGWYPEFKFHGCFHLYIFKSNEKVYEGKTRSIKRLKQLVKEAVELINV